MPKNTERPSEERPDSEELAPSSTGIWIVVGFAMALAGLLLLGWLIR